MAVLGKNCQLTPLSASVFPWKSNDQLDFLKALLDSGTSVSQEVLEEAGIGKLTPSESPQSPQAVKSFEAQLPSDQWKLWFDAADDNRRFDRAVAILKSHDGEAFVQLFYEKFESEFGSIPQLGDKTLLETLSFSRWSNPIWLGKAEGWGRTPEDLRGMVSFSLEFINNPENLRRMKPVLTELKELSC